MAINRIYLTAQTQCKGDAAAPRSELLRSAGGYLAVTGGSQVIGFAVESGRNRSGKTVVLELVHWKPDPKAPTSIFDYNGPIPRAIQTFVRVSGNLFARTDARLRTF